MAVLRGTALQATHRLLPCAPCCQASRLLILCISNAVCLSHLPASCPHPPFSVRLALPGSHVLAHLLLMPVTLALSLPLLQGQMQKILFFCLSTALCIPHGSTYFDVCLSFCLPDSGRLP